MGSAAPAPLPAASEEGARGRRKGRRPAPLAQRPRGRSGCAGAEPGSPPRLAVVPAVPHRPGSESTGGVQKGPRADGERSPTGVGGGGGGAAPAPQNAAGGKPRRSGNFQRAGGRGEGKAAGKSPPGVPCASSSELGTPPRTQTRTHAFAAPGAARTQVSCRTAPGPRAGSRRALGVPRSRGGGQGRRSTAVSEHLPNLWRGFFPVRERGFRPHKRE